MFTCTEHQREQMYRQRVLQRELLKLKGNVVKFRISWGDMYLSGLLN